MLSLTAPERPQAGKQLELWKYGFRMQWPPTTLFQGKPPPYVMTTDGWVRITEKDIQGWTKLSGAQAQPPFTKDLARAVFWCPPHPPEVEPTAENIPFMQVYKQKQPDVWTKELLEMTMFDLLDEYLESEPLKVYAAYLAAMEVAHGHFQGMAVPAFGGRGSLLGISIGLPDPVATCTAITMPSCAVL